MRVAVIGYGSMGKRHADNIKALGHEPVIVSKHLGSRMTGHIDAAVICNETERHVETALSLPVDMPLLIEKPVALNSADCDALAGRPIIVGYNYRFVGNVPIEKGNIFIHLTGYLPDWHPGEDYTKSYAARDGAMLTLSHPIDYLRHWFGDCAILTGYKFYNQLPGVNADCTAIYTLQFYDFLAHIHVDYIERPGRHELHTDGMILNLFAYRDASFYSEMRSFLEPGNFGNGCTLADARAVLKIVESLK